MSGYDDVIEGDAAAIVQAASSRALAKIEAQPDRLPGTPLVNERVWAILAQIANTVYSTEFVPRGVRGNKAATLAAMLYGHEQHLGPMTALGEIHMIDGRPTMSAALMLAKIRAAGHSVVGEVSAAGATVTGTRSDTGDTMTFSFTEEDATRAGLLSKDNWKKYPAAMYWARAVAQLARFLFSDVFIGSVYTPDELGAVTDEDEKPVLVGAGAGGQNLDAAGDVEKQGQLEPAQRENAEGVSREWLLQHDKIEEASGDTHEGRIYDLGTYLDQPDDAILAVLAKFEPDQLKYIGWVEGRTKARQAVMDKIHELLDGADANGEGAAATGNGTTPPDPAEEPAPADGTSDEPAPLAFAIPASARLRVLRVSRAVEILHGEMGEADWALASVLAAATSSFKRTILSIDEMTDGELDSIWKHIPAEVRERVQQELPAEAP